MILLRRIIPFFCALVVALLLEGIVARQWIFWYAVPIIAASTVVSVGMLLRWRFERGEFWQFLVSPASLVGSSLFFLLFIGNQIFAHVCILITAFLVWSYLENLFLYSYRPDRYQPYALEHISLYSNLLAVFALYAALYAARIFLSIPLLYLAMCGGAVSLLFAAQLLVNSKIPIARGWVFIVVLTLIMLELFVVVSVLPTTFPVAGLLIAIPYYLMMNVTRHAFRQTLSPRVIIRNVCIGIGALVLTAVTAPWI